MIHAFHSILTAYGFWLPNEPRGSWSSFVASWELLKFGPATKVDTRRSMARNPYHRGIKSQMQAVLSRPSVTLTGEQAREVVRGFSQTPYKLYACAVMPEHVHLVIGYTPRHIRKVVSHLKSEATRSLRSKGWFLEGTPWTEHGWNVYLNTEADVLRAINYVEQNPVREGKQQQTWRCVVPYVPERGASTAAK
ncbi:MAG: transposase [Bythopirellula sp.]|nr:transposase [Bythopirellula sp.]